MLSTIGLAMIVAGGAGLALVGLYGLAPGLFRLRRRSRPPGPVRIEEKRLSQLEGLAGQSRADATAVRRANQRVADELFAELFSLRADLAAITQELRSLRDQLEAAGLAREAAANDETPLFLRPVA